jgi:hypothetical protein
MVCAAARRRRLLSHTPHAWQGAYRRETKQKSALDASRLGQAHMSIRTIATILTFVCFGIAFICWSWLSIEESRRHTRQKALEEYLGLKDPEGVKQLSEADKLMSGWALPGGNRK